VTSESSGDLGSVDLVFFLYGQIERVEGLICGALLKKLKKEKGLI
jgi:hypothetical protein